MKKILFLMLLGLIVLINACSGAPAPTQAVSQPTNAPAPTDVPSPPTAISGPTTAPAPTQAPNTNLEPPSGDPFNVIRDASLAQLQAKSFRATTSIESGDGQTSQLLIEYLAPDRLRVKYGEGREQIAIKGKGAWTKDADTWEAAPPGYEEFFFKSLSPEGIDETLKTVQVKTIRFVGVELLDGKPTFVYEYESVVDAGGGNSITGTSKIWIGATDRRTYRVQAVSDSITKQGAQDKTTVIYEYDIPLTIEPPI